MSGSPFDLLIAALNIGVPIVLGAGALAKVLKTFAEAYKTHQEGIEVHRRNKSRLHAELRETALYESLSEVVVEGELSVSQQKQLDRVVTTLNGQGRQVRLAQAVENLTSKNVEIRINDPHDPDAL